MRDHDTVPYSLPDLPDEDRIARARALRDRLKQRRSCRYFSDRAVPRAIIEAAIEAAPRGGGSRRTQFLCRQGKR
jgi:iodotyrosine deiodinase